MDVTLILKLEFSSNILHSIYEFINFYQCLMKKYLSMLDEKNIYYRLWNKTQLEKVKKQSQIGGISIISFVVI
ncbi:MAG TPA: hypothetical protein VLE21_05980, partial [Candidatus Nitrosocosmicus sp.]|nr:hypothetical protein [Candidatus Nitrosocosmicus sp.]